MPSCRRIPQSVFHPVVATICFAVLCLTLVLTGCSGSGQPTGTESNETDRAESQVRFANPIGSLKLSSRSGQWDEAWLASEAILAEAGIDDLDAVSFDDGRLSSIDSSNLLLIARAAHETGRENTSVILLQAACKNGSYSNAALVRQTMIAMIGVGRYHEGLGFLEQALVAQPEQDETRRWLFDFYIGADDRVSAIPHGRQLVLRRKFDIELLDALSNTERRTLDPEPLDEMVARNPDDKRPLLGTAKGTFDESKYDEAIKLLREIVQQHPEYHPAQALLGQAFVAAGKTDALSDWAEKQSSGIEDYPGYWIALGDWARTESKTMAAIRCFAQGATCVDGDVVQIWTRLATLVASNEARSLPQITPAFVDTVNQRAKQLTRFHQLKDRFNRTGKISRQITLEIAESLEQLGRLWESEAWASIATTLPEDESVDVKQFRAELATKLAGGPPWQLSTSMPNFDPIVSSFPLPSIEKVVSSQIGNNTETTMPTVAATAESKIEGETVPWKLDDEASLRGIDFWGRTSETLDQPGIMLYQTLGCGGGTIDYDLDGWSDLYLVAAGGTPPNDTSEPNALLRNLGGEFKAFGIDSRTDDRGFGQGVAVGDVNEDGFPDLLVLNYGPNRLYLNNGDGTFRDANSDLPDQASDEWSTSAAIADLDGDGLNDIVVVNYCAGTGPVTQPCPMSGSDVIRSCSPMLFNAAPDQFLQSTGDGSFEDASSTWQAETESPGRGLGIVVGNLDSAPGNEVFVANDMTNNHYWSRDNAGGRDNALALNESATLRGLGGDDRGIPQGSMGIATADFDHDGDADFYVTNFDKEYNTLHLQTSQGIWQDRTRASGLVDSTTPLVGFGTEAIDLDNNGVHEIVLTNGHVDLFSRGDEKALYDQPTQIFRRTDGMEFRPVDVAPLGQYFSKSHVGRGLWTIDANRDGKLDFAVTHQTEPTALIVNHSDTANNWLRIKLVGRTASRDAIGSVVRVGAGEYSLTEFRLSGHGYQCSNDAMLHFGLGSREDRQITVSVTWPTGETESFRNIATRSESILVQGLGS